MPCFLLGPTLHKTVQHYTTQALTSAQWWTETLLSLEPSRPIRYHDLHSGSHSPAGQNKWLKFSRWSASSLERSWATKICNLLWDLAALVEWGGNLGCKMLSADTHIILIISVTHQSSVGTVLGVHHGSSFVFIWFHLYTIVCRSHFYEKHWKVAAGASRASSSERANRH